MIIKMDLFSRRMVVSGNGSFVKDHKLVASQEEVTDQTVVDAEGLKVLPGLVDIHTHGAVNADASDGDADGLRRMSRYYAQRGVTSWCPTTMTLSEKSLLHAMHAIRDFESDGAHCVGVHLEGPFLSYENAGHRMHSIYRNRIWKNWRN